MLFVNFLNLLMSIISTKNKCLIHKQNVACLFLLSVATEILDEESSKVPLCATAFSQEALVEELSEHLRGTKQNIY